MDMSALKNAYQNLNTLRGKKLYNLLAVLFVVCLIIGTAVGYFIPVKLNQNEQPLRTQDQVSTTPSKATYKGIVTYIGENEYSNDKIEYALNDINGNGIILLKSEDEKLSIAQGLYVTVTGTKTKTGDGKSDVLQVMEVILKNVSD